MRFAVYLPLCPVPAGLVLASAMAAFIAALIGRNAWWAVISVPAVMVIAALTAALVHTLTETTAAGRLLAVNVRDSAMLAAGSAAWLVPVAILLYRHSPWVIIPGLLFLLSLRRTVFSTAVLPDSLPRSSLSMATSLALQGGCLAFLLNRWIEGAALAVAASLLLGVMTMSQARQTPTRGSPVMAMFALMIAVAITAVSVLPGGGGGGFGGGTPGDLSDHAVRLTFASDVPPSSAERRRRNYRRRVDPVPAGPAHPGVILFPEVEEDVLIAPPSAFSLRQAEPRPRRPLDIPFHGVYWFLESDGPRPPGNAIVQHGTPDRKGFRTADYGPLRMEARQNLGRFIDPACCRAIEVAIRDADSYVASVHMELALVDTRPDPERTLSLGAIKVRARGETPSAGRTLSEVLSFAIPPAPAIREFDELKVTFRLHTFRNHRSARIAIQGFRLLTR